MASINRIWRQLLGVEGVVVEGYDIDESEQALIVSVRPMKRGRRRCAYCHRRAATYDQGGGLRRWRALDLGTTRVFMQGRASRVVCPDHGVVVADVPWARPNAGFTKAFEEQCAWLSVHTNRSAVAQLMRVSWRTIGRMIERVVGERLAGVDLLSGLRRIGIDEISYRKGHRYMTVVIDHDTKRLVWMAPGRDKATVLAFFDALGPGRAAQLELISADAAAWIDTAVRERAPQAKRCMDPFHVVQWATKALDEVRRAMWNDYRKGLAGTKDQATPLKNARWALLKNPEKLNPIQKGTLAWIESACKPMYRAYLLKETLRGIYRAPSFNDAKKQLDAWLSWACRSRIAPFVKLSRTIRAQRERIELALEHRLSNAVVEGKNTQLRLIQRMAHGFRRTEAFIGLAMLKLSGICPPLPGRG